QPLSEPVRRVGRLKAGSLEDLRGLADDLGALIESSEIWHVERPDGVRAHVFEDAERVRVVFVLSDVDKPLSATLFAERTLRDPFTNERISVQAGKAQIALGPRGVRMFVVD
ncbi:MAG: hypothetical protein H0T65_18925, partial [Deltaproteobacteria bacterium]|nr:hypothetical protein [Deltaproteobacteria bacterium]